MYGPDDERLLGALDARVDALEKWRNDIEADEKAKRERLHERFGLALQAIVSAIVGWVIGHVTVHFKH